MYWLAGFFNPQGFLTSVRQEITRSHSADQWALDKVETRTEVRSSEYKQSGDNKPEDLKTEKGEVVIYGLYLESAMWDKVNKRLKDPFPGDLYRELPMMLISAFNKDEKQPDKGPQLKQPGAKQQKKTEYYRCPVYKYPSRTDLHFIFDVLLPVAEDDAHWRMRGVALLGTID